MKNATFVAAAIAILCVIAERANAQTLVGINPGWNIDNIDDTATNPSNGNFINLARNPDGNFVIRSEVRQVINYADSASANSGQFHDGNGFPEAVFLNEIAAGGADQNNFLQRHTGFIEITQSGAWTLQNETDDPFYVEIGTNSSPVSWTDTSCCNNQQITLMLDAGIHPIEVIMAEFGGGDHVEFSMAFGPNVPFSTGTFHLVGDTANGGLAVFQETQLVPEPASAALWSLVGLSLCGCCLFRRRFGDRKVS